MARRFGLGPVFAFECLIAARRWQTYAVRSLFVSSLLAALIVVYTGTLDGLNSRSFHDLSRIGMNVFFGLMGTQLVLVMMTAPAATAGAFCLDRARGTLAHLLVTDLSNPEIVLGKLAARLLPVLGVIAGTLPVLLLASQLGGIDPNALLGAELITLGLASLGCSMALLFSLWVGKTHEALLGSYAVWVLWLLAEPMSRLLANFGLPWTFPRDLDPFQLAFAPYLRPGRSSLIEPLIFAGVMIGLSLPLVILAICLIRRMGTRERVVKRKRAIPGLAIPKLPRWSIGPSLDFNPVLWREWHRAQPSRGSLTVLWVYAILALVFSGIAAINAAGGGPTVAWVNGLQATVGFLILSVASATSLAEERVRGSLDVLMATSLTTREIVIGKWLGAFRSVPVIMLLPSLVGICGAWHTGYWNAVALLVLYMLSCGALITSVGLALATWVSRMGRAVGLSVGFYVMLTVGWLFLCVAIRTPGRNAELMAMASPFMGVGGLSFETARSAAFGGPVGYVPWGVFWTIFHAVLAGVFLVATLMTFNRCLGRVEGEPMWVGPRPIRPLPASFTAALRESAACSLLASDPPAQSPKGT